MTSKEANRKALYTELGLRPDEYSDEFSEDGEDIDGDDPDDEELGDFSDDEAFGEDFAEDEEKTEE